MEIDLILDFEITESGTVFHMMLELVPQHLPDLLTHLLFRKMIVHLRHRTVVEDDLLSEMRMSPVFAEDVQRPSAPGLRMQLALL